MYRFNDTITYNADVVLVVRFLIFKFRIVLLIWVIGHTFTSEMPVKYRILIGDIHDSYRYRFRIGGFL